MLGTSLSHPSSSHSATRLMPPSIPMGMGGRLTAAHPAVPFCVLEGTDQPWRGSKAEQGDADPQRITATAPATLGEGPPLDVSLFPLTLCLTAGHPAASQDRSTSSAWSAFRCHLKGSWVGRVTAFPRKLPVFIERPCTLTAMCVCKPAREILPFKHTITHLPAGSSQRLPSLKHR